jgi:siroheme synthase-like protein
MGLHPSYPVNLLLEHRHCLVVGGGELALQKVRGLLEAGARVTVVASAVHPELVELPIELFERRYEPGEAARYQLVIAATGNLAENEAIFADAERSRVFVNTPDDPAHCSFITPASGRAGRVSIAISTDGASPALASFLRDRVIEQLPRNLERVSAVIVATRDSLRAAGRRTEGLNWRGLLNDLFSRPGDVHQDELERVAADFAQAAEEDTSPGA